MNVGIAQGLVIAGGAVIEVLALWNTWLAHSSRKWVQLPGRITKSKSEEIRTIEGGGGTRVSHQPKIQYSYEYQGKAYSGKKIAYSIILGSKDDSDELVEMFPKGAETVVYVHPRNPKKSVILTGIDLTPAFISLAVPPVLVVIGLLVLKQMNIGQ